MGAINHQPPIPRIFMIHLSDRAIVEIDRLQAKQADPALNFRLRVIPQGCAGLSYAMGFDPVVQANDHHWAIANLANLAIVVDPKSWEYLQGLAIDYTEDLMGGGFQFTNPQAVKTCDCGISFAIAPDNTTEWTVDCGL
jgi:iron-sulfur cluster assembly protein